MKVLHIGEYVKGGVATYINEILEYQSKEEMIDEVFLLASDRNSEKEYSVQKNQVYFYNYSRKLRYFIKAIMQINRYITRIKPDILHIHSAYAGFFVRIIYFFKKKNVIIVYCSHGWSFLMDVSRVKRFMFILIEKLLEKKTDLIINISENEFRESISSGISRKKSVVIYNGLSNANEINEDIKKINLDNSKTNLLFVGRFDRQKGVDILLNVFRKYKFKNIKLYLIGSPVLGDINSIVKKNMPKNVINLGWINNREIDSYYRLFDAVIIPSRWEGFGLVAIEAMRNKKAVIASNRGALPEIIKHGVNGYIFNLDDENELVNCLNSLKKDDLKKKGVKGYKIYQQKFTSDAMNKSIIKQYMKLVNSSKKGNKEV